MNVGKKKALGAFAVKRSVPGAGLGLYAMMPIKKGAFVVEYTGKRISDKEADEKGGKYLFDINSKWTIDGTARSNTARYINHSCRPNCEARTTRGQVKIYARRAIKAGEELTYDYGKEYVEEFIKPIGCRCGHCFSKKKR